MVTPLIEYITKPMKASTTLSSANAPVGAMPDLKNNIVSIPTQYTSFDPRTTIPGQAGCLGGNCGVFAGPNPNAMINAAVNARLAQRAAAGAPKPDDAGMGASVVNRPIVQWENKKPLVHRPVPRMEFGNTPRRPQARSERPAKQAFDPFSSSIGGSRRSGKKKGGNFDM